jgi:hypothetical protein
VSVNGLTASQILNGSPGIYFEAASFGAPAIVSVTNDGVVYVFDNTGAVATYTGNIGNKTGVYSGPSTGDTNLDAVFSVDTEVSGATVSITLNNLTPGTLYSAQLFSINDVAGSLRQIQFADSSDATDLSAAFLMGDNVYVTGTFVAANSTEVIYQKEADTHGYISAVIVRQAFPTMTASTLGSALQLNWNFGTVLESTNVSGPYTPTAGSPTSPYLVTPAGPAKFYRVSYP